MLASGLVNGDIKFWNLSNPSSIVAITGAHSNKVLSLKLSKNKMQLASCSLDQKIRLWNLATYNLTKTIIDPGNNNIDSIEYINDTVLVSGATGISTIILWNLNTGLQIKTLSHSSAIGLLFIENKYLLSSDVSSNLFKKWSFENFNYIETLSQGGKCLKKIDSNNILFLRSDGQIGYLNLTQNTFGILSTGGCFSLEVVDNNAVAIGRQDNSIEIWNIFSNYRYKTIPAAHSSDILAIENIPEDLGLVNEPTTSLSIIQSTSTSASILTSTPVTNITSTFVSTTIINQNLDSTISNSNKTDFSMVSTVTNFLSESQSTNFITSLESTLIATSISSDSTSTQTNMIDTTTLIINNPFSAPIISISAVFSSSSNMSLTQLIDNLQNKSFSFDLKPSSNIPSSLLTSNKYDIADCVSNCSNQGLCKVIGFKFACQCSQDFTGSKCEIDLRPCSNNPCLNFIKCDNVQNGTYFNQDTQQIENYYSDFICSCKDKYYGKRCESKINLCQNETCSGNGVCKVITNELYQNESIKCECYGINSFEGDKCETKSAKMVVHEASVRTTSYIALAALISLYLLVITMDIHKYFVTKNRDGRIRPVRKEEREKAYRLHYVP